MGLSAVALHSTRERGARMTRFEFYDRYRLFIPITHLRQFDQDLSTMLHEELWRDRYEREPHPNAYSENA